MQSKIKKTKLFLAFMAAITLQSFAHADSISDAIAEQEAERIRMNNMAVTIGAGRQTENQQPILSSILAMGHQYVLKFTLNGNRYIATEQSPFIGDKWKLISVDGLSALIQRGKEKPVKVYLSVPDDIEQSSSMVSNKATADNTIPPQP